MSNLFVGKWRLYGTANSHLFVDSFHLPHSIASRFMHVNLQEQVQVDGNKMHVQIEIPPYDIPAFTIEENFNFGEKCNLHLVATGATATGTIEKLSDSRWTSKLRCDLSGSEVIINREICDNEMHTTIEAYGAKMVRKFGRTKFALSDMQNGSLLDGNGNNYSSYEATKSPFSGTWNLLSCDGSEDFFAAVNFPQPLRELFASMHLRETIHVNGNHVNIRVDVSEVHVPLRVTEETAVFGEVYDCRCQMTGAPAKGTLIKASEKKWIINVVGLPYGELAIVRELVNGEMWLTFETPKGKIVRMYERCKVEQIN